MADSTAKWDSVWSMDRDVMRCRFDNSQSSELVDRHNYM